MRVCVCFSPGNLCCVSQLSNDQLQSAALTSKHTLHVHTEACALCVKRDLCKLILCVFENSATVSLFTFLLASCIVIGCPICLITRLPVFLSLSLSLSLSAEFSGKSEDKDGNSLAFQFLSGAKVTVLASKTSRESDYSIAG